MIGLFLFGAMFLLIDVVAGTQIPAVSTTDDSSGARDLMRSLVACAIWIPYIGSRSGFAISFRLWSRTSRRCGECRRLSMRGALVVAASTLFVLACSAGGEGGSGRRTKPGLSLVRSIRREADAEHTIPVALPMRAPVTGLRRPRRSSLPSTRVPPVLRAGGRASSARRRSGCADAGGIPPSRRLVERCPRGASASFSTELVAAPEIKSAIAGGIPLRVASKRRRPRVERAAQRRSRREMTGYLARQAGVESSSTCPSGGPPDR